jgi:hypothetical protein
MLRNIFVSFAFLSTSLALASQEIDNIPVYITELESKIDCNGSLSGNDVVVDSDGRDVEVLYFCKGDRPELQEARIFNDKKWVDVEINKVSFGEGVFTVREKYFTFYDNGNIKTTTEHFVKYNVKDDTKETKHTIIDEYSEDRRILKTIKIQTNNTTEESWEYFPNGARSKYTVIITTDKDKSESIIDYDQSGEKIRDTEIYYDLIEKTPYKKAITEYDLKSQKIVQVVVYEYENGVEKFKTVDDYEKGKLFSKTYYELIYDEQGKLKKEKKTGKDVF